MDPTKRISVNSAFASADPGAMWRQLSGTKGGGVLIPTIGQWPSVDADQLPTSKSQRSGFSPGGAPIG
ncbi:hypothetical protein CGRA01v4_08675 [Colletotrichum graminicola]|nr:hypothetical protein CGRA01v4_08675 [Colletotrichum graminicola]